MLLLKTDRNFKHVLASVSTPIVILPATVSGESQDESKKRANDLAVTARVAGLGVSVVESATGELYVMTSDNESQALGFGRRMLTEAKLAGAWFLLILDAKGPLLRENGDRDRERCTLTETGFVLPDGRAVEIVASYIPAQRNTAWGHHLGQDVGENL